MSYVCNSTPYVNVISYVESFYSRISTRVQRTDGWTGICTTIRILSLQNQAWDKFMTVFIHHVKEGLEMEVDPTKQGKNKNKKKKGSIIL